MLYIPYRLIIKESSSPYSDKYSYLYAYFREGELLDSQVVGPHWTVMKDVTNTIMVVFNEYSRN